jgi:hypothetical protein
MVAVGGSLNQGRPAGQEPIARRLLQPTPLSNLREMSENHDDLEIVLQKATR